MFGEIEVLNEEHEVLLGKFKGAEPSLTKFLRTSALYYAKIGEAVTHVLINQDHNEIIGYFTLKCISLKIHDPEMRDYPLVIPAIEISRFAIHIEHEDGGIGKALLARTIEFINYIKYNIAGVKMITLFAIPNEKVLHLYEVCFKFKRLDEDMEIYY